MFFLLIEDFGVGYVDERHAIHLKQALAKHYKLTQNWKGDLNSIINLEWNYDPIHAKRTVRLTTDDYIANEPTLVWLTLVYSTLVRITLVLLH